jgi:chromosome segregation ATPase
MSVEWLNDLEEKVRAASSRLRDLRDENGKLRRKIAQLEERLAAGDRKDAEAWMREREEIRQRVERLVEGLSQTLGD